MVFAVGYKMLSPKDPLQTFGRVLAPAAKIAKPAFVSITDVLPGDTQVFFGDPLEVTAVVRGLHQPQDVMIEFSTLDGQLTNQQLPMRPDGSGNRYRANLSMAGSGIQQSLSYRVVARDGSSPDFKVMVQPNPTIAVESLELQPPAYTRLPVRSLNGQGNIDALEGTEITVHAVANLPINVAYIELLNEINGMPAPPTIWPRSRPTSWSAQSKCSPRASRPSHASWPNSTAHGPSRLQLITESNLSARTVIAIRNPTFTRFA